MSTVARRPRILLLCYACSPERGSECAVGWNRALQAARFFDTWVICEEEDYGDEIRSYLQREGTPDGLTFCTLPMTPWQRRLARTPGLYYRAYHGWQRTALQKAQQLHAEVQFDLVHQVNYCGFREPGYAWQLPVPFVLGPLGGTQNLPSAFLRAIGLRGAITETVRSVLNRWQLATRRRVRRAVRAAEVVLAANSTNRDDLARALHVEVQQQLETGLSAVADEPTARESLPDGLRILWSGQFLPFKALPLLLEALAALPADLPFQLRVLGDGRCRQAWQRRAARLGLQEKIRWLGWLPHHEALEQYRWADAFAFTSLRDTSGNVVLEALASGVPVIGMDHQGCQDMITPECGIQIPVDGPDQVVAALRDAVVRLSNDPSLRQSLSAGALERGDYYLWSRQGERMAEVYQRVLAARAPHLEPLVDRAAAGSGPTDRHAGRATEAAR